MSEDELNETRDLIHGIGRFKDHLTDGIFRTYTPLITNENLQARLHEICLELERRGEIKRKSEDKNHVCWVKHEPQKKDAPEAAGSDEVPGIVRNAVPESGDEGSTGPAE